MIKTSKNAFTLSKENGKEITKLFYKWLKICNIWKSQLRRIWFELNSQLNYKSNLQTIEHDILFVDIVCDSVINNQIKDFCYLKNLKQAIVVQLVITATNLYFIIPV